MATGINDLKSAAPLSVPREELITILNGKLAEKQGLRDAGLADAKAAEQPIHEAIARFTPDEILGIFREYYTVDVVSLLAAKRSKQFVPEEEQIPAEEERLTNIINLLTASQDKAVELDSSSELYKSAVEAINASRF